MQIKGLEEEEYQKDRTIHDIHTNVRTSIATHFMATEKTVQLGTYAHTQHFRWWLRRS